VREQARAIQGLFEKGVTVKGSESSDVSKRLGEDYLVAITGVLQEITKDQFPAIQTAASWVSDKISSDELVYVYGPGGHSNLAAQEVFFRAGGLMNVSAILDGGTLLSNGALRSMQLERTPGYGRIVIADNRLTAGDLLILVNAYGINAALIDAALEARERGVRIVGISSRAHATKTPATHPARHPSRKNLHDLVDLHIDSKIDVGDVALRIGDSGIATGALSTFANAFVLNTLMATAIAMSMDSGIRPAVWVSGNATGGDEANKGNVDKFRGRASWL
jgi:uncharacterized phosphosugar-binding protein